MERKLLVLAILLAIFIPFIHGYRSKFLPEKPLTTHPQLTNAEKWKDYFRAHPIGRMYHLYHATKEVGVDVSKFPWSENPDAKRLSNWHNGNLDVDQLIL